MAKVILDIPAEKMTSFIRLILQLGIDKHAITSGTEARQEGFVTTSTALRRPRRLFPKFLLFDWEFYSNELEFE